MSVEGLSELPPQLELDNQLCFPLYAASRLITRLYQEKLAALDLTYPQYIVMMILWERAPCAIKVVSERALLNTNTLTPLLKRLESLGFVIRQRSVDDERVVMLHLTDKGKKLQRDCECVPEALLSKLDVETDELIQLKEIMSRLLPALSRAAELK
ncbi:Organic hydroperoxide resistance transcriptional regulator [Zhongshania aliphaticivorans]|uniref:Organic hydroperoxide resistance transcriptional regulator n=1 Tax=Zhongshania aliphaticivorans TaxID=1470434 RepID=A0A5S9NEW3_9GAMM|nr:MarR family transcriptional regulator [Zhongshania aliphaticivorans]CAA0087030.1 Organic hydroperoxide resistance transcriptional regulator [Zhongshania aliphaticivorans]CAA0113941.1 Organic hydroperoxide resistance transcriptional regulator [Zhongshania aliphaticivorans]